MAERLAQINLRARCLRSQSAVLPVAGSGNLRRIPVASLQIHAHGEFELDSDFASCGSNRASAGFNQREGRAGESGRKMGQVLWRQLWIRCLPRFSVRKPRPVRAWRRNACGCLTRRQPEATDNLWRHCPAFVAWFCGLVFAPATPQSGFAPNGTAQSYCVRSRALTQLRFLGRGIESEFDNRWAPAERRALAGERAMKL
jgi:hypothetical protein